ncbi:MAG: hypothetical protein SFY69_09015 [Planctomycetota bacterium]|nr:hypothetical protein [Planctomycetota bacterium]
MALQDTFRDLPEWGRRLNDRLPEQVREAPLRTKVAGGLALVVLPVALWLIVSNLSSGGPVRFELTPEQIALRDEIHADLGALEAMSIPQLTTLVKEREKAAEAAQTAGDEAAAVRAYDALERAREMLIHKRHEANPTGAPKGPG